MKKALKIIKITAVVLVSLLVAAIIAGVILYQTTFKEPVQEMMSSIDNMIESGELFEVEDGMGEVTPTPTDGEQDLNENEEAPETTGAPAAATPSPTAGVSQNTPKKPVEEYESTYDYVKDNVAPSDFAKGSGFASRVDIGYILGLLSGGLTRSERKELKQYLSERFTEAEIDEGIALYKKYSYLLKGTSKK